jgi:cobalt-zinc-cadmium efflux system protein
MAGHHAHHGHSHEESNRGALSGVLGAALALTLGYAFVELISGLAFGSLALVSDAGHMFSDALALGLVFAARVAAPKKVHSTDRMPRSSLHSSMASLRCRWSFSSP